AVVYESRAKRLTSLPDSRAPHRTSPPPPTPSASPKAPPDALNPRPPFPIGPSGPMRLPGVAMPGRPSANAPPACPSPARRASLMLPTQPVSSTQIPTFPPRLTTSSLAATTTFERILPKSRPAPTAGLQSAAVQTPCPAILATAQCRIHSHSSEP